MSPRARLWGALAAGLVVVVWAWLHGPFDGLSLVVELTLLALLVVAIRAERRESQCPHCGTALDAANPHRYRGDAL